MKVIETIPEFRDARKALSGTVGFVPSLGAIHKGHRSLLEMAHDISQNLVVSLFLNPSQFGPNEDLDSYPQNLENDLAVCREVGAELVFLPNPRTMYPDDESHNDQMTHVVVDRLPTFLCGATRPTHFRGVTTVVTKLFNIVQPDVAVFGQKDFQQLMILRRMVRDLNIPVSIVAHPTVREEDGLAVSSRNLRLTAKEREIAPRLSAALAAGWRAMRNSINDASELETFVRTKLEAEPMFKVDYVSVVDAATLEPPTHTLDSTLEPVLLAAVYLGNVRLIDNLILSEPLPSVL